MPTDLDASDRAWSGCFGANNEQEDGSHGAYASVMTNNMFLWDLDVRVGSHIFSWLFLFLCFLLVLVLDQSGLNVRT
eukprot:SAG31_NODE_46713_length_253_cov_0.675325_1_plen_76_part_10